MYMSQDRLRLNVIDQYVLQIPLLSEYFCFIKISKAAHNIADLNTESPDERYPKLNIYILEFISDSHKYVSVAHVKMYCLI